jgi:hypothetical protein
MVFVIETAPTPVKKLQRAAKAALLGHADEILRDADGLRRVVLVLEMDAATGEASGSCLLERRRVGVDEED